MTRKGHKLDKFDEPPTVRKPTSTSPWAGYLRCDECGVDAGKACRDMDDLPALEVCEGRRLFLGDSVDMTRRPKAEDAPRIYKTPEEKRAKAREYARQRRTRERKQAQTAPCACCGATVRITAKATYVDQVFCRAPDCRRAYSRAYEARRRRDRRQTKATCRYCGAERVRGRGDVAVPACASEECARKAKTERQKARRAKPKPTYACFWCNASMTYRSGPGNPVRPCCGAVECAKARKRTWEAENRAALTPSTDTP